jgi:hypothetical protein
MHKTVRALSLPEAKLMWRAERGLTVSRIIPVNPRWRAWWLALQL